MKPILEIDNFKLAFHGPAGRVAAVRGVSLSVYPGEAVALVGESGCGKTSLVRAVLGLHSAHAITESGSVTLDGCVITDMTERALESVRGRDVSMVFQDPMSSLNPVVSVGGQIAQAIRAHEKVSRREAWSRAVELLGQVGIPDPELRAKQYPHHFSGGMRQRVAIAIALACSPKLLIADEPTTSLDTDTQKQVMELLRSLVSGCPAEERRAMLFITHDLGLAELLADRIIVMKDGLIVEEGKTEEIFSAPKHEYTKKLLHYAAYGKGTCHYHGRIAEPAGHYSRTAQCDGHPLVRVKNLSKHFSVKSSRWSRDDGRNLSTRKILNDFSMNIYKGEIVGIVGPSGCGKSTLARCMTGILQPESGSIEYCEGTKVQMIFQDSASAMNPRMTIGKIIAEPLVIETLKKGEKVEGVMLREKVREVMEAVGLEEELANRYPYDISGGQRQRAAIARALITDPDFIIADEPISSLDVSIQSQIIHLLKKLHEERQLTMMIIAHDLPMVEHVSDRIIEMK